MHKKLCYLCGEFIENDKSKDHIPPRQFYASLYRKELKLNLTTSQTHKSCNFGYKHDEDYFFHSLAPIAMNTKSGSAAFLDIIKASKYEESKGLIKKVLNEFTHKPYGQLCLPHGLIGKKIEIERINRVIWKITRGLYFKEFDEFIPEQIEHVIMLYDHYTKPCEDFKYVRDTKSRGKYPGVFDYKTIATDDYAMWGMLFWDYFIALVVHKRPKSDP